MFGAQYTVLKRQVPSVTLVIDIHLCMCEAGSPGTQLKNVSSPDRQAGTLVFPGTSGSMRVWSHTKQVFAAGYRHNTQR